MALHTLVLGNEVVELLAKVSLSCHLVTPQTTSLSLLLRGARHRDKVLIPSTNHPGAAQLPLRIQRATGSGGQPSQEGSAIEDQAPPPTTLQGVPLPTERPPPPQLESTAYASLSATSCSPSHTCPHSCSLKVPAPWDTFPWPSSGRTGLDMPALKVFCAPYSQVLSPCSWFCCSGLFLYFV